MHEDRINALVPLQKCLCYQFKNIELLGKALTHKSYSNEVLHAVKNNERLEFLGDSVLDLIVSDYIFFRFKGLPEGSLSKIRAAVVNEKSLAGLAKNLKLGGYISLGKGESFSGGKEKASILANAYEALVGALFCDSDFGTTADIFLPQFIKEIDDYRDANIYTDFKSHLQEYTQHKFSCVPLYKVVEELGPSHDKQFNVKVIIRSQTLGYGKGRSKKEAEQIAAKHALSSFLKVFKKYKG
ncbi:MAG: ribonuclease III [Nitrospina sp.]|nr:ribonuclease III [Nitrospina sp.]